MLQDEVTLLQKLPIFSEIDPARLRLLCFASERRVFPEGKILYREGEESRGAYVILSGTVELHREGGRTSQKSGSEEGVAIIGQGSLLNDPRREDTVTALTEVEALRINNQCFLQLMSNCPKSSEKIMRLLGQHVEETGDSSDRVH